MTVGQSFDESYNNLITKSKKHLDVSVELPYKIID
jgi:hypothetical protein